MAEGQRRWCVRYERRIWQRVIQRRVQGGAGESQVVCEREIPARENPERNVSERRQLDLDGELE